MKGLPPGGALHRSVRGPGASWTDTTELLAQVVDLLQVSNLMFLKANSKRGTKVPPLVRVPRPGDGDGKADAPKRRSRMTDAFRAFAAGGKVKVD